MSLLRNELQVALNDLHVAALESADNYRDAAEFVQDEPVARLFVTIAEERDHLAQRLAKAIRDSGDLPSVPDADKETGEQLLYRLESLFSADQVEEVIRQRLQVEDQLAQMLADDRAAELGEPYESLLAEFEKHIEAVQSHLSRRVG